MSSVRLRKKKVEWSIFAHHLIARENTFLCLFFFFYFPHQGTNTSLCTILSALCYSFFIYGKCPGELHSAVLTLRVFLGEILLFHQFFESHLRSLHAITHTATQALQPRTGASLEEIEEQNSERTEKHLLLRTLASTVKCKRTVTYEGGGNWSHAHKCNNANTVLFSATVITEAL